MKTVLQILFFVLVLWTIVSCVGCVPKESGPPRYQVDDHQLDMHEGYSREAERARIRRDDFRNAVK